MPDTNYRCDKCGLPKIRDKPPRGEYAIPLYRIWYRYDQDSPPTLESDWKQLLDKFWSRPKDQRVKTGFSKFAVKFLVHRCKNKEIIPDDEAGSFFWKISLEHDDDILKWLEDWLDSLAK